MSSFLGTRGTCGFNFDLIKSHSSSSSTCSSTLSKSSSVSSLPISIKRARTPRKRPNQTYMEAATLLSNACPSVFSTKNLHKKQSISLSSSSTSTLSTSTLSSSEILLSHKDSDFLIELPSHGTNSSCLSKLNPITVVDQSGSMVVTRDVSPPKAFDCDAYSIFDDNDEEGIDSIMGKLSMNDGDSITSFNPFIGFGNGNSTREAFRGASIDNIYGPMMKMVQIKDIVTQDYNTLEKKKKKNIKMKTKVADSCRKLDGKLGLKLVHEEVVKAWGDRGFPFLCDSGIQESSAEIAARLAGIDLSPDEDVEAGKCKKTRKLAKKFCYQVRKVNAECMPRVKGRFVKKIKKLEEI